MPRRAKTTGTEKEHSPLKRSLRGFARAAFPHHHPYTESTRKDEEENRIAGKGETVSLGNLGEQRETEHTVIG